MDEETIEQPEGSDENLNTGEETNTPSKSSNWKKMQEKYKKQLASRDAQVAKLQAKLKEKEPSDSDDLDDSDYEEPSTEFNAQEYRLFRLENKEAQEYSRDEFEEMMDEYPWLSFEKILRLLKAEKPKSKSKTTIDLSSASSTIGSKDLAKLSEEDALKLPPYQYYQWEKAQKK